jgi:hypothetical protein
MPTAILLEGANPESLPHGSKCLALADRSISVEEPRGASQSIEFQDTLGPVVQNALQKLNHVAAR